MKCARMSMTKQWTNIGRRARRFGISLETALTTSDAINKLIRAGYEQESKRRAK